MIQRQLSMLLICALILCAGCRQGGAYRFWPGGAVSQAISADLPSDSVAALSPLPPVDVPPAVTMASANLLPEGSSSANPAPDRLPTTDNAVDIYSPAAGYQFNVDRDLQSDSATGQYHEHMSDLWPEIKQDFKNYYSWENFSLLVAGFSVGAVAANTKIDAELNEKYQKDVRSSSSDNFAVYCKKFGTGEFMLSAMAAGWLAGDMLDEWPAGSCMGEWGERGLRSALVGAPPMLLMQYVTGAARPFEDDDGSGWRPFTHANGVSGHAFIGGLVFINAAKMTDNGWLKTGFYAASFLPAWSRVNDNAHFPSQAFLGWWMAYCACTAVDTTYHNPSDWRVVPLPTDNGAGMAILRQY